MKLKYIYVGKKQLIQETANATGFPIKYCKAIINEFLECLSEHIVDGKRITLPNFGIFKQRFLKAQGPHYIGDQFVPAMPVTCIAHFQSASKLKEMLKLTTPEMIKKYADDGKPNAIENTKKKNASE